MSRKRMWFVALMCAVVALAIGGLFGGTAAAGDLAWAKSFDAGMKEAAKTGKPVMIDIYTDWCDWCKELDKDVYTSKDVVELGKDFGCIKLNPEKDPGNGAKFGVEGFPTIIFTNSEGKEIQRVVGYRPADKFVEEMKAAKKKAGK